MVFRVLIAVSLVISAGCSTTKTAPNAPEPAVERQPTPSAETPSRPIPADTLYDLLVAEVAGHRSQYDLALENYKRQAIKTRDAQVAARATQLAQYQGELSDAEEMAALWLELEPDNADAQFIYALTLSRLGQSNRAFGHMQRASELGGQASITAIAIDSMRHSASQRAALLQSIDAALGQDPDDAELLMAKSIVLQATDPEAALATARAARIAAPDDPQPAVLEATLLQQLERVDEATQVLEEALDQHPDSFRLRLQYARLLTQSDLHEAQNQFETLLTMNPADPDLIFYLGLISQELEQYDIATTYFRQLLEMGARQSEAHYYLGMLADQRNQPTIAIGHFEQVEPGTEFLPAMTQVARLLLKGNQQTELRQLLADKRRQYPAQSTELYLLESDILIQLKDYRNADLLLGEALALHPENTNLLYTRSLVAEKRHDIDRAEADLQQILKQEPENAMALNALGYILTNHSERYDEALKLIESALKYNPDDPTILDSMGWVKYRLGDLVEAQEYLQQAYARHPDAEIAAHLGEVLWQSGQRERALEVWREGLVQDPDHTALIETIERFQAAPLLEVAQ